MVRVFCDFDGTVASVDVGNRIFRHFAGEESERIVEGYLLGQKSAIECLTQECAAAGDVTPKVLEEFVAQFGVDPYFPEFVRFCDKQRMPLTILSDGLDFYVSRILARHGLAHVAWFANHLEFKNEGSRSTMVPVFPYTDSECPQCGNCKRNHMLTMSADEDIIVYIGDGISDRCPVRYADIVFAKKGLLKFCQEQNITYHEFRTFHDVQERFHEILHGPRLRKRREAEMARRDVFMQG